MQEQEKEVREDFRKKVLDQFLKGEPLMGKSGALAPLLKEFLETALEAEMEAHLGMRIWVDRPATSVTAKEKKP